MAFSTNGGGMGSRRRGVSTLSEINVTPFVDVVLVLLIIFMLTAHVMEFGIEVNVPETRQTKQSVLNLPVVTISKAGVYTLDGKPVNIHEIKTVIEQTHAKAKAVYVRADKDTIWDAVAQMTAELGAAGFQVNMVTQPVDESAGGRR
jgi:biopolymer transport protein ExbD